MPVQEHRHPRPVGLVRTGQHEVDREGRVPDPDVDRQPPRAQRLGDLVAVPVHGQRKGRGGQAGRHPAVARQLQVGAQVLETLVPGALSVQILGVEAGEDQDLPPRPGDGHVEAALPSGLGQGAQAQGYPAAGVGREGHREQDRVPLLALHVLQVLHEQPVGLLQGPGHPVGVGPLPQEALNKVPLRGVEGDDAQGGGAL